MKYLLNIFFIIIFFSNNSHSSSSFVNFSNPIIKFVPKNYKVTSGYLTIRNIGEKTLELKSVYSNFSEKTEIHYMKIENDIMKMKKINKPIIIPPGRKLVLKPDKMHIMFIKINKELIEDEKEEVIFNFKNHGQIKLFMKIKKVSKEFKQKYK